MEQLITDRLRDNLTRLNLNRASEVLQSIAEQAEADKRSYLAFLDQLLEEEVAVKEKRRFQTAMKTAGLPTAKSIDEYESSFHPQLNKKEIMALFDMEFIEKQENVIFLGPPGVGKTHLAISLAIKACSHGFKVYFTTMDTLQQKFHRCSAPPHKFPRQAGLPHFHAGSVSCFGQRFKGLADESLGHSLDSITLRSQRKG